MSFQNIYPEIHSKSNHSQPRQQQACHCCCGCNCCINSNHRAPQVNCSQHPNPKPSTLSPAESAAESQPIPQAAPRPRAIPRDPTSHSRPMPSSCSCALPRALAPGGVRTWPHWSKRRPPSSAHMRRVVRPHLQGATPFEFTPRAAPLPIIASRWLMRTCCLQ